MNILKDLWNGHKSLVATFWGWGLGLAVILGIIVISIFVFFGLTSTFLYNLIMLPYTIFISVAIWRSATNYDGSKVWAILAKVSVILGIVYLVHDFINPQPWPF